MKKLKQLKKGLIEAITGTVIGFVLAAVIDYFARDGIVPWYTQIIFTAIGIIGSLITISKFKSIGFLYIIGWVAGSWLLKDLLGTVDFVLLIIVPVAIILLRVWSTVNRKLKV